MPERCGVGCGPRVGVGFFVGSLACYAPGAVEEDGTTAGSEDGASFSPDGNQVAFSWTGPKGDNPDIYIKMVEGATPYGSPPIPLLISARNGPRMAAASLSTGGVREEEADPP